MLKKLNNKDLTNVIGGIIVKKYYYGGDTRDYRPHERFYSKETVPSYMVFNENLNNIKVTDFLRLKGGYNEDALGKFNNYQQAKATAEQMHISTTLVDFTL